MSVSKVNLGVGVSLYGRCNRTCKCHFVVENVKTKYV